MYTEKYMIETARDFVNSHKNNNLDEWMPINEPDENKKLVQIFDQIIMTRNRDYDDDGNFTVQIRDHESASGQTVLFDVEYDADY